MVLLLLAVIYLAFISLGLPDSLLGSAWPVMRLYFDVPLSYSGLVSMTISAGTIVSSLLSEKLTRKLGTGVVTLVSVFFTASALFGFSSVTAFWQLILWAVPYGLGAGAIDAALNNYVALHYSSRHMSWLHSFWGVGTIISPYIMSFAITHSSWTDGYRYVSFIQFAITVIIFVSLPLWKIHKSPAEQGEAPKALGLSGALKIKGVMYLLTGFFCYCAAEQTIMLWASSYLVGARGVDEETAAALAALFFMGMTAGRFASGFVSDRLGDRNMVRLGFSVAFFGILLILLPVGSNAAAFAGLVITGLGCAPVYPSIIHSTPSNFGEENSQGIIGVQMASAYVGSTFMPPVFGVLAGLAGLKWFPFYVGAFLIGMMILTEKMFSMAKAHKSGL